MKLANCTHEEERSLGTSQGKVFLNCPTCGQTRRYIVGQEDSVTITHVGRINGAIVMPPTGVALDISPEESRFVKEGWDILNERTERHTVKGAPISKIRAPAVAIEENEDHQQEILADYEQMYVVDLEKKWGMPRGKFCRLKKKWEAAGVIIPTAYADRDLTSNTQETYYDQHRDEILADRLSIGHGKALTKWKIAYSVWLKLSRRWRGKGIEVVNLTKRRADAATTERQTEKRGFVPTAREERGKTPAGQHKEFLKAQDTIEITVGRLEEILREIEWLRGYRQAVLDQLGITLQMEEDEKSRCPKNSSEEAMEWEEKK